MRTKSLIRRLGPGAIALVLLGLGADTPPQTIVAHGLTFQAPAAWKSSKLSSPFRIAQLKVEPAEGDADPAELVVTAFAGGAGSVEQNLARWRSQFRDQDGNPPKLESKTVPGKNTEVIRVEVAGRYVAPKIPGGSEVLDKPNYRLLGAIVQTSKTAYFFKMLGPDKTMIAARPAFDALLPTIQVEK
ncbi:MAG: hypothetical protein ACM35G_11320 [Planctomycetaceae bacterium]